MKTPTPEYLRDGCPDCMGPVIDVIEDHAELLKNGKVLPSLVSWVQERVPA